MELVNPLSCFLAAELPSAVAKNQRSSKARLSFFSGRLVSLRKDPFNFIMAKKNTFGFIAFTAAAGLGLALTTVGCGTHNGSTTPGTLSGNNNVIFKYSLAASGRTFIHKDITQVCYSFTDSKGNVVKVTNPYDLKHSDIVTDRDVSVPSVPSTAKFATAAYYDSFGSIVAVGINGIAWDYDNAEAIVLAPQVSGFAAPSKVGLQANRYVLSPEETTTLSLPVQTTDGSKNVINLISFADVTGIDEYADVLSKSDKGHTYTGVSFTGIHEGKVPANAVKAVVPVASGNITALLQQPIYVTAQTLASIEIAPSQIDKQEVTIYDATSAEPYSKVLICKQDVANANLGQKVIALQGITATTSEKKTEVVAVGSQSFTATAIYTQNKDRGPVPENVDVTGDTNFTVEQSDKVVSIVDNNVTVNSVPSSAQAYVAKVTASYNDNGKLDKSLTDTHALHVHAADSSVFFAGKDTPSTEILSSIKASEIPSKDLYIDVFGKITYAPDDIDDVTTMGAENFILPKTIIDKYPQANAWSKSQGGAISTINIVDNQYRVSIDQPLTDDWFVELDQTAYGKLGLPKFIPLTIENK